MSLRIFKKSLLFFISIILVLGLSISFQSLLAAWTAPTANPPTCAAGNPGCDAPINVGSATQSKIGNFGVTGTFAVGDNMAAAGSLFNLTQTINPHFYINANKGIQLRLDADNNDAATFQVNNGGNGTIFTLDESGNLTVSGNVGIGTTDPNRKLEIYESRDDGVLAGIRVNNPSGSTAYANVRFGMELYNSGNYEGGLWATRESKLYLQSGASNKPLVLQNNGGNVGIGTTGPTTGKLVVSGGKLDMSTNEIINVAGPTASSSVATKGYVDAAAAGRGPVIAMSAESAATYTHANAAKYCYDLSAAAAVAMDGNTTTIYTDWRLPTVGEAAVFEGTITSTNYIWTATMYEATNNNWLKLRLSDGKWGYNAESSTVNHVRCVR